MKIVAPKLPVRTPADAPRGAKGARRNALDFAASLRGADARLPRAGDSNRDAAGEASALLRAGHVHLPHAPLPSMTEHEAKVRGRGPNGAGVAPMEPFDHGARAAASMHSIRGWVGHGLDEPGARASLGEARAEGAASAQLGVEVRGAEKDAKSAGTSHGAEPRVARPGEGREAPTRGAHLEALQLEAVRLEGQRHGSVVPRAGVADGKATALGLRKGVGPGAMAGAGNAGGPAMPLEEAGTSVSAPRSLEEGLEARLIPSVTHAASTSHDARRERSSDADADRTSGGRGGASEDASAPSASSAATFDGQLVAVESRGPSHVASTVPSTHAVRAERLAEAVAARVPEAPTRFSITVTPESLGAVEVQLVVRGQAVQLSMQAASEEARDTLAAGMDELRAALLSRGLSLSGADVGTQGEGAQHAPRPPRWEDDDGAPRDSRGIATVSQSESTRPTRPTPRRTADGRVDLHA